MKLFIAPKGFNRGFGEFYLSFTMGKDKDLWGEPIGVEFRIQGPPTEPNLINLLGGVLTFKEAESLAWQLFSIVQQAEDAGFDIHQHGQIPAKYRSQLPPTAG